MSCYAADDFLWTWPELSDIYFDDLLTAFGHTPTMSHGKEYTGKIGKTRTWTDIGVAYGQKLVLLRLDDLQEFYFG